MRFQMNVGADSSGQGVRGTPSDANRHENQNRPYRDEAVVVTTTGNGCGRSEIPRLSSPSRHDVSLEERGYEFYLNAVYAVALW